MWIVLFLFIYIITSVPTVYWWDNPEAIIGCFLLDIGHSPGYAIYHLIGKLFTFLPAGNTAFRCNLFSAFLSGLCIILYYNIAKLLFNKSKLIIFSIIMFSTSFTFWFYSTQAEVYTMYYLFILLMILILLLWNKKFDIRYLYLLSFMVSIALSLHISLALLLLPFIYFIIIQLGRHHTGSRVNILVIFLLILLGSFFQIYLPIRASSNLRINFGIPYEFTNFYKMVTFQLGVTGPVFIESINDLILQLKAIFYFLILQFSYGLAFLPLIGAIYLFIQDKKTFYFLFLIFILPILPFIIFKAGEEDLWNLFYFLIPTYIIAFIFSQGAVEYILNKNWLKKPAIVLFFGFIIIQFVFGFYMNNRSKYNYAYITCKKIFELTNNHSVILTDNIGLNNLLNYYQIVEGVNDRVIICTSYLRLRWYLSSLKDKLIIPEKYFNYCNDKIKYNDKISAIIAKEIFINNRNYNWYTIFSKSHEQEVFYKEFLKFNQKKILEIVEFKGEKIPSEFVSVMSKIIK